MSGVFKFSRNFRVVRGRLVSAACGDGNLTIGNVQYQTRLPGIAQVRGEKDFRGTVTVSYHLGGQRWYLVFGLWYRGGGRCCLVVLGTYSHAGLRTATVAFRERADGEPLRLALGPMARPVLKVVPALLKLTRLSGGDVLVPDELVGEREVLD